MSAQRRIIERQKSFILLGTASIDTRDESPRARTVLSIRRIKGLAEEGLLGACSQIAPNRHQHKCGPHDRCGNPECGPQRQQVQSHVDRMAQDSEWTAGDELMTFTKRCADTPRAKVEKRRDRQRGASGYDQHAGKAMA